MDFGKPIQKGQADGLFGYMTPIHELSDEFYDTLKVTSIPKPIDNKSEMSR